MITYGKTPFPKIWCDSHDSSTGERWQAVSQAQMKKNSKKFEEIRRKAQKKTASEHITADTVCSTILFQVYYVTKNAGELHQAAEVREKRLDDAMKVEIAE